jgi:hypothetical protein
MRRPPAYFEEVQRKAACRWDQLEEDPELAAPWHQLFKQVQEPSHVVSELLQNADDAGATEASVRVDHDVFVFEHNGEDFRAADFGSLCTFGYSNKRALHTIGFRGITRQRLPSDSRGGGSPSPSGLKVRMMQRDERRSASRSRTPGGEPTSRGTSRGG